MVPPFGMIGPEALGLACESRKLFPHVVGFGRLCDNFDTHLCSVQRALGAFEHDYAALDSTFIGHVCLIACVPPRASGPAGGVTLLVGRFIVTRASRPCWRR